MEENLVWKLISYIFQLYESYEIKFHTKISSFTVFNLVAFFFISLDGESLSSKFDFDFLKFDFNICQRDGRKRSKELPVVQMQLLWRNQCQDQEFKVAE